MNLGSLGQDSIAKYGEHESFYFEGRWYTNVEMELNANRLGNALKSLGIRRGDRVAIQMPNSPVVLWSFPAIYKIGAVAVPMNPLLRPDQSAYIFQNCGAKAVITSPEYVPWIQAARKHTSELRNVIPIMAFCAIGYMGNSSGETKNYYVYEDQENYLSWKEGALPDSNIISYPKFNSSNANPNNILIAKINRTSSETVIDFIAYNSGYEWLRISPNTYIEFEKQKYKVRTADNIVLGEKNDINKYNAWKFRLHFPAIPSNADYINISEEESSGWKWNGVSVKK